MFHRRRIIGMSALPTHHRACLGRIYLQVRLDTLLIIYIYIDSEIPARVVTR
jgi:hypothetical protein